MQPGQSVGSAVRAFRSSFSQGPRPAVTAYQQLNAPPVVPEGFENWSTIMDTWGNKVCPGLCDRCSTSRAPDSTGVDCGTRWLALCGVRFHPWAASLRCAALRLLVECF